MTDSLSDRLKDCVNIIRAEGFNAQADALEETLNFSGSSSELYFKSSSILGGVVTDGSLDNQILIAKLTKVKEELDKYTR